MLVINGRRNNLIADSQNANRAFDGTGRSEKMSCHGLCRADPHLTRDIFSQSFLDGQGFDLVVQGCRGSVRVDVIDLLGTEASILENEPSAGIVTPTGVSVTGGANGVLIPTVFSNGSNDYALATTAFTYNANGLSNIPKAAVTARSCGSAIRRR